MLFFYIMSKKKRVRGKQLSSHQTPEIGKLYLNYINVVLNYTSIHLKEEVLFPQKNYKCTKLNIIL